MPKAWSILDQAWGRQIFERRQLTASSDLGSFHDAVFDCWTAAYRRCLQKCHAARTFCKKLPHLPQVLLLSTQKASSKTFTKVCDKAAQAGKTSLPGVLCGTCRHAKSPTTCFLGSCLQVVVNILGRVCEKRQHMVGWATATWQTAQQRQQHQQHQQQQQQQHQQQRQQHLTRKSDHASTARTLARLFRRF